MKRRFSILIVLMVAVFIFVSCSGNGQGNENDMGNVPPAEDNATQNEDLDENLNENADASPENQEYKDGTYTAEAPNADNEGWKDSVTVEIEGGQITSVQWDSVNEDTGEDKTDLSESGEYGMVEKGGATAEWHEQAEKTEAYLVEKQDPNAFELKDDGSTDAVAGVTINIDEFVQLAQEALDQAK